MSRGTGRLRVTTVVGARPQFVKLAPVSRALRKVADERIVHTGQHYDADMSRRFFDELEIPEPDAHLGVGSGTHAEQLGRTMTALEADLRARPPDAVLVFGDTNSTLGAAIAVAKAGIPLAHVEAGVRGYDPREPEEINRVLTDRLATWLFVPTRSAVENLAREGIEAGVHDVGDVMVDVLLETRSRVAGRADRALAPHGLEGAAFILATFHRPFNVDDPGSLEAIGEALGRLDHPVVWPVHPRARARLEAFALWDALAAHPRVHLVDPAGYPDMVALTDRASLVVTDSGGLQKEAFVLGVPCVTVSAQTAWVETVDTGWNRLVAAETTAIVTAAHDHQGGSSHPDCYGTGDAAPEIARILAESAGRRPS